MSIVPRPRRPIESATWIRAAVTAGGIGLAVIRVAFPQLQVDLVTVGLLIVAVLPWLFPFVKSAKLPGGWEITFRDVQSAVRKIGNDLLDPLPADDPWVAGAFQDPNLALVHLRIELEKRLRTLAQASGVKDTGSLSLLIEQLKGRGLLPVDLADGLHEFVTVGNQAAHGATVEPVVSEWAAVFAPRVIGALDRIVDVSALKVRSGPGPSHPVIGVLKRGTPFEVVERSSGWNRVRSEDGVEGWINAIYTDPATPDRG